jgi:putative flippase GtrA
MPVPKLFRPLLSRNFILYCAIGVSGITLDALLFYVLTVRLRVHYEIAQFFGVSLGITNNFAWNALLNFKVKDRLLARFAQFYMVGLIGMLVGAALLFVFIELFGMHPMVAKLSTVVVVTLVQYTLNVKTSLRATRANGGTG